jgi:hypothetical protein
VTKARCTAVIPKGLLIRYFANINRCHLSKSQRAMAVAMIYPDGCKKETASRTVKSLYNFSHVLLAQARQVLKWAPELQMTTHADGRRVNPEGFFSSKCIKV